jgi:hypothetical protein
VLQALLLLAQLLDVWAFTGAAEASGTSNGKTEKIDFDMGEYSSFGN